MQKPKNTEYRVVEWATVGKEYDYWYSIDEVYCDENGKFQLWEAASSLEEKDFNKLKNLMNNMILAFEKPILILSPHSGEFFIEKNKGE